MSESTHLLKPYAVTVEVSKENWQAMQHLVQNNLETELRRQCFQKGLTIHNISFMHTESVHISEDGVMYETVQAACKALVYQLNESAEQTLHKMRIDEAQQDWTDEDE